MHTLRLFVKGLAIFAGLIGALWALGGPLILIRLAFGGYEKPPMSEAGRTAIILMAGTAAILGVLGYLIARQCWIHLRRPDVSTARTVLGVAGCLLIGELFYLYGTVKPGSSNWVADRLGAAYDSVFGLSLILACYLSYRLLLKPLAERAFPVEVAEQA
jgi:hypothetical protein